MDSTYSERRVGDPTELFVYAFTRRDGRKWRRRLVRNTTVTNDRALVMRDLPFGRYRIEWRDARRWIAHVETWVFDGGRVHRLAPKRQRRAPRKVPPPIQLPPSLPPPQRAGAGYATPASPRPKPRRSASAR